MQALTANLLIASRLVNYVLKKYRAGGIPSLSVNEILVKVSSVTLSPTDFKHIDVVAPRGTIIGCDYAGKVAKVGHSAPGNWKTGDRVAGWIPGDLPGGSPATISDEEASTYGVSAVTAMLALNTRLAVPWIDRSIEGAQQGLSMLIYAPYPQILF
ncbi:hypothetical protein VE01_04365 [Pseudogymnoascus verrucosus]|uniref:Alcohol dehydrogenase-like N-terminal domain-containing protein n=1 Tax=Pseudogymnoascus verrucosus TaxID=342668 RepID=A0A1B8GNN1_9PEZI|nr:uncharacterized protein VE01_04365 [Pseudogymnoascus verrucosus]OBT97452.1 hypothetical protein VE01_04365 [Pseudogymnoascus verrucosus]